jgi:anti-sigma factor RsiW
MICADCRELLPLHLYGDLSDADRTAVAAHLSDCGACRAELGALAATRAALDAAPVPETAVDLNRIYRFDAERQRRTARRWRVAALVGLAASLLVLALRIDIRADARQLTVRWGTPEPMPVAPEPTVIVRTQTVTSPDLDERLNVLTALIHALAANVETGDRERAAELMRVRGELASLRQQGDQRWTETGRSVSALYTAQFGPKTQGDRP